MISKQEQLINRGFLSDKICSKVYNFSFDRKIMLLKSVIASERTLGARLLKENKTIITVNYLIEALKVEKKLYSKIEICNTLMLLDKLSVLPLINCLGTIGNNQHRKVPKNNFLKDSYPLPRDIASRTLIRIGYNIMPDLLKGIKTADKRVLSELIDTIGHVNFKFKKESVFEALKTCYKNNNTDDLIKWKLIRACSGIEESECFLIKLKVELNNNRLKEEIERSLQLILKRKKK